MLAIGVGLAFAAWLTRPPQVRRFAVPRPQPRWHESIRGLPLLVGAVTIAGVAVGRPLLIVGPAVVGVVARRIRGIQHAERAELARAADLQGLVDHMVGRLRGGSTLVAAFRNGAVRSDGPWAAAVERLDVGQPISGSLASDDRNHDTMLLTATIDVLERTGAPATDALERLGDTLRERAAHRRELATQARHASASATVLAILPLAFASVGAAMSGDLAAFYLETWIGAAAMTSGVALSATGWVWLHHLMREAA